MDFLLSSLAFALLDSFVLYYAKRFNLHNARYLGENAISLFSEGWGMHARTAVWRFHALPRMSSGKF